MSKLTRYAMTSQTLSVAAMEEASRRGLREADLADLFLALVLNDQPAGQVLRDQGITIESARAAVEGYQKEQIASLGIAVDMPPPGSIVFHRTAGYEWSRRASDLLGRAAGKGRTGDAAAVLSELLGEPSGLLAELLPRVGTTPAALSAQLEHANPWRTPKLRAKTRRQGEFSGSTGAFAPAPVEDVWALLTDPRRVTDWDTSIGSVEVIDTTVLPGMTWPAHAQLTRPDGKPLKVSENYQRRMIELEELQHPGRVAWQVSYPDARFSRPVVTAFELVPAEGGTQLTITMTWSRRPGWRSIVSIALAPLQRFLIWMRLSQISSAVSRAFRQS